MVEGARERKETRASFPPPFASLLLLPPARAKGATFERREAARAPRNCPPAGRRARALALSLSHTHARALPITAREGGGGA